MLYTETEQTKKLIALGILAAEAPREKELNRFGVMIWDHKTGGTCQVLNGASWKNAKRYNIPRRGQSSVIKSITG